MEDTTIASMLPVDYDPLLNSNDDTSSQPNDHNPTASNQLNDHSPDLTDDVAPNELDFESPDDEAPNFGPALKNDVDASNCQ
jgi:hypothetical protein